MQCHCYTLRVVGSTHNEEKSEEIKTQEVLKTKKFFLKKEKQNTKLQSENGCLGLPWWSSG